MMKVWIAIMMTCSGSYKNPEIKCDYGASEGIYKTKLQCETEAPKTYKRSVRCIDIDVTLKEKDVEVILK